MSIEHVLQNFGALAIFATIFLETGFLFGIFLPGDSLLFTAGILAGDKKLVMSHVILSAYIASVLGYTIAYYFGKKLGPKVFNKQESFLFKKSNVVKAHKYFEKFGGKIILFARLIPIVRTIVPVVAGVGEMNFKRFMIYNIIGGALWTVLIPYIGLYFGKIVPNAEVYIGPLFIIVIVISFIPAFRHLQQTKEGRNYLKQFMFWRKK
jgi:membrane-associated protein